MKYLLDASVLLPLVTRRGKQLIVDASRENLITTDLALYEACNSLWKLVTLLQSISLKDAVNTATLLQDLTIRNIIQLVNYTKLDFSYALKRAHKENLTFYDTSYIATAEKEDAVLVTEDEKLRKAANKFVKTAAYKHLENRLSS